MKPMTVDMRIDANGQAGEPFRVTDGQLMSTVVDAFVLTAMCLEVGGTASLVVARVSEGKQPPVTSGQKGAPDA